MKLSIPEATLTKVSNWLEESNLVFLERYPGDPISRQPVHTIYGGAQLFVFDISQKLGKGALKSLAQNAPKAETLAKALGLSLSKKMTATLYNRVVQKLKTEPVEDFRIDYEDGYGNRSDSEEDGHAEKGAKELARGMRELVLPPFIGIRIKPFTEELKRRSIRTLDIFLSTLLAETNGKLPRNFSVTLPKVTTPDQVAALKELFEALESTHSIPLGTLKMEIMVETTQSIFNQDGVVAFPSLLSAGDGRITGAHFGTYDYTASNNIVAQYQSMDHPACDFAHQVMKVCLGQTGVWLSDGATNILPVGSKKSVRAAWQIMFRHVRYSLKKGLYQGWDLHPAQLPVRYAACYSFFLEGLEAATTRLKNFIDRLAQATSVGEVFDDAATGQGLLNFFLRAKNCGAITDKEILATGLTPEELQTRSFAKIVTARRSQV